MSSTQKRSEPAIERLGTGPNNMALEVIVIPISDVDRSKPFEE